MAEFPTLEVSCRDGSALLEVGEVARLLPNLRKRLLRIFDRYVLHMPLAKKHIMELLGLHVHDLVDSYGYQLEAMLVAARDEGLTLEIAREDVLELFMHLEELQEKSFAELVFLSELNRGLHFDLLLEICQWGLYRDFIELLTARSLQMLRDTPRRLLQGQAPWTFPRSVYHFLWPKVLAAEGEGGRSLRLSFLSSLRQAGLITAEASQVSTEALPMVVAEALAEPLREEPPRLQSQP